MSFPLRLPPPRPPSPLPPLPACPPTQVLDEADQLLEMGFRPAIEKILGFLPRTRQTLLFSATMPQSVQQVAGLALKKEYKFIDTIK